jgi:hypothetical protein
MSLVGSRTLQSIRRAFAEHSKSISEHYIALVGRHENYGCANTKSLFLLPATLATHARFLFWKWQNLAEVKTRIIRAFLPKPT